MLTINLYNKPTFAEFLENARLLSAINNDFAKHKRALRMHLESFANQYADGDLGKFFDIADKIYAHKISDVTTQEEYDALFNGLYDEACIASVIATDIRTYCAIVEYYIDQIKYHESVICPCCGREMDEEVLNTWQADLDEHRHLEFFYNEFYKARRKNLATMRQLAENKKFDPLNWQKDLKQTLGTLARVEEIEDEPSEVSQVLDDLRAKAAEEEKRVAIQAAEEWLAGRSQN